ncbi:hypothetical protein [Cryptosporangium sp. NPDC048952]|uniref:hypothetical protein n=1 Tax=Cryptosporangium sp. NPDC048952 TaxID=3363961 RepID=UPI003719E7EA
MTVLVAERRDLGVFLGRIVRLDAGALVRIRPSGPDHLTLWAALPFDVLVARTVPGSWLDDATVSAAELLESTELPRRRDSEWRGSLPPDRDWQPLDTVPADVVRNLITAGQKAFRAAGTQAAGESLLDHETLRVSTPGSPEVAVTFRLLLALARMAFLGDGPVGVSSCGPWVRLTAEHGTVYHRTASFGVTLLR